MNPALVRMIVYGLLSGALLSAFRAPRGLDWTQLPHVDGRLAGLFRAGALIAIALFLDRARSAFRAAEGKDFASSGFLFAVAGGYAVHAGFVAAHLTPESRTGFFLLLIASTLLLRLAAGPRVSTAADDSLGAAERIGLVLVGAGASIAFENLALQVRQFGLGLPADDALMGTVFLIEVAVGAVAFGTFVARPSLRRIVPAAGVTLACAATVYGLHFLAGLGPDPLFAYLKRFDLDYSRVGMWTVTGCIAGASFVVPAFLLGTSLSAARNASRLGALVLGAGVGLIGRPVLIDAVTHPMELATEYATPWASHVAFAGVLVAALGALLAIGTSERRGVRIFGALLAVAAPAVVWAKPVVLWSISPWYVVPLKALLVLPTATGIVTVEEMPDRTRILTVDRKRMTPAADETEVDAKRILYALSLLEPDDRANARVLLIGQITHERADLLARLNALVDRTAPWYETEEIAETLEDSLFDGNPPSAGTIVTPAEARNRIREGRYELVIVLPAHGPVLSPRSPTFRPWGLSDAPVFGALDVPAGTIAVGWVDAAAPLAGRDLGDEVVLAMDGFRFLTLGIVRGDVPESEGEDPARPAIFPGGEPGRRIGTIALLDTLPWSRMFIAHRELLERLAGEDASPESATDHLLRGLAIHFAAQKESAPWDSIAEQTEIEEDALREFFAAMKGVPPLDAFTRELWEGLASLLKEKRLPEETLTFLEPVAEAYAPWPPVERAVARAYLEFLQPDDALRILERTLEHDPYDIESYLDCASILAEKGESQRAAEFLRRALEIHPGRYDLRRALGFLLFDAGDPEGRPLLEELLVEDPEDESIRQKLYGETLAPPSSDE